MATSGSVDSGGYQGRVLRFSWNTQSINSADNTRVISYSVIAVGGSSSYYYHHNETVDINGTRVYTGSDSHQVSTNAVLASGTLTINQSNTQTLTVKMHGGIYSRTDNINKEQSWVLDEIPRYANLTSLLVESKTINSITFRYTTDKPAWLFAKVYNDDWLNNGKPFVSNSTSGTFTIYFENKENTQRLSPNTTYNITVLCRALGVDSGLDTSKSISVTTYDIGKISSVDNFNHGDSTIVKITNPSGSALNLVMKIGNTQIQSRAVSIGNNTLSFNDSELDNIYKLYGSSNFLTATFILTTAGSYTNSKTCIITLRGNQKTAYLGKSGRKRAKVYVGTSSGVKRAVVWIGNNGRKRCI